MTVSLWDVFLLEDIEAAMTITAIVFIVTITSFIHIILGYNTNNLIGVPILLDIPLLFENGRYLLQIYAGIPQQEIYVALDTSNEGLHLFSFFLNSSIKKASPIDELKSVSTDFSIKKKILLPYNILNSTSSVVCSSQNRPCLYISTNEQNHYECDVISSSSKDAHYFSYSLFSSSLFKSVSAICETRAEGFEVIHFPIQHTKEIQLGSEYLPVKYVANISVCPAEIVDVYNTNINTSIIDTDIQISGLFGVSGYPCRTPSLRQSLLSLTNSNSILFRLKQNDNSRIQFMSSDDLNVSSSEWVWFSQSSFFPPLQELFFFEIYFPTLCDNNLAITTSSHWGTIIDINYPCLGLPEYLFESMIAWLSLNCSNNNAVFRCQLNKTTLNETSLPALSFYTASYNTDQLVKGILHIPLSSLLLEDNYLCIDKIQSKSDNIFDTFIDNLNTTSKFYYSPLSFIPPIRLGWKVLSNFLFIVNYSNLSIGFRETYSSSLDDYSNALCSKTTVCVGQQQYNRDLNKCIDPNCHLYLFKEFNPETKTCDYKSSVLIAFFSIGFCAAVAEYYSEWKYCRTLKFAKLRCH